MSSERCTAAEIKERLPLFGQFALNLLVLRMEPVQIPIPRIVLQRRHVGLQDGSAPSGASNPAWHDQAIEGLRFLGAPQRTAAKRVV